MIQAKNGAALASWPGLLVILTFGINSATFTLGIVETSATVVLTAVATMPYLPPLYRFWLREKQGWLDWLAIILAMGGVAFVVGDGDNAVGSPNGSVILGAFFGVLTAFGLALTFTMARKYPRLGILPAAAIGASLAVQSA